jgi:VanZ family protein
MLAISVLSSFHRLPAPPGGLSDKHVHALVFGLLAVLWCRAIARGRYGRLSLIHLGLAWVVAVAYGALDEWHQAFVPGRSSDVLDLAADATGALLGVIACGIIGRFVRRRDGVAVQ